MTTLKVLNGDGVSEYLKSRNTGTEIDPKVVEHDSNLLGVDGNLMSIQNPLVVDGDSIYAKDINVAGSSIGGFSGVITDIFDDLDSAITDSSATNPKTFTIKLNRPINNTSVKFCSAAGSNFSNVKIILYDRGGSALLSVDDTSNSTKYTSNTYGYSLTPWCTMVVEFHTADAVGINWALLEKSVDVHAIIQVLKPDATYADATGTQNGNQKFSLEEIEDAVNPIRKNLEGVGDLAVGVTEVAIAITGTPTYEIRIRADVANTGIIFIGKTGVLADGSNDFIRLDAGDEVTMNYDDSTNALYAISDTAAQVINIGALL